MEENVNKLMELMKTDEALRERLCGAKDKDAVIAIAAERGVTLTDADFEVSGEEKQRLLAQKEQFLQNDELDVVAGRGNGGCGCALVGGGGGTDVFCGCIGGGKGTRSDSKVCCFCFVAGVGKH